MEHFQYPVAVTPLVTARRHSTQVARNLLAGLPMIESRIEHDGWIENQTTIPLSRLGHLEQTQLDDLGRRDFSKALSVDVFGHQHRIEALLEQIRATGIEVPETTLHVRTGTPGGIQVGTYAGVDTRPLYNQDGVIGHMFEDSHARYCVLGDVRPLDMSASRPMQATAVMEAMQSALSGIGMHFRDVVRTWFYNDHILDWYGDFNNARGEFFKKYGIGRLPASTGIGVSNFAGAALTAKAFAVQPKSDAVTVRRVDSPLQCEACAYGSAFSRAMEVADPSVRVLYVSGTASIHQGGETAHESDAAKQIETTMEVIRALLEHAGMDLSHTTRGIAYFRHAAHIPVWSEYCRQHDLSRLPIITVECDVCRDNLLFEIELDAARPQPAAL